MKGKTIAYVADFRTTAENLTLQQSTHDSRTQRENLMNVTIFLCFCLFHFSIHKVESKIKTSKCHFENHPLLSASLHPLMIKYKYHGAINY